MKIKIALMVIFYSFVATSIFASPPKGKVEDVSGIDIVEYGIYKRKKLKSPEHSESVAGKVDVVKKGELITKTDTIPLELGLSFGVKYKIVSNNKKKRVYPIRYRVVYPKEMTNPKTGKSEKIWTFNTYSEGNKSVYSGFGFGEEYELLEGIWIFEFTVGDYQVVKKFYMVKDTD